MLRSNDTRLRQPSGTTPDLTSPSKYLQWASAEGLLYHPAVMDVPGWNQYGSAGFKSLTRAQQVLMYWEDLVGQVSNGGIEQLHENMPNDMGEILRAIREIAWGELLERFEDAHLAYIAPSTTQPQWLKHRRMFHEFERERLIKLWRKQINTYQPAPIYLFRFWQTVLGGKFETTRVLKAWRRHYRKSPDPEAFPGFAVDHAAPTPPVAKNVDEFNRWFWSDEAKIASVTFIERYVRDNLGDLIVTA